MARTILTAATKALTTSQPKSQPLRTQRSVKMKKSLQTSVAPNNPRARHDSVASDRRHARADMAGSAGRSGANLGQASFRRSAPAATTTPASARGRASSGINKSAFVRALPSSLSAAEVIEKGKAKGIKLSAAQVYTIRANARRKGPDTADTARLLSNVRGGVRDGAGRSGSGKARGRADGKEAEFVAAALDLGLARAEALIRALRARASSGWR